MMQVVQENPEKVQRRAMLEQEVSQAVAPVPAALRQYAQPALGYDLSTVHIRYHAGLPGELGVPALAFRRVILQEKENPNDTLHELAHIVQNAEGRVEQTGTYGGLPVCEDGQLEQEAEQFAHDVLNDRARMTNQALKPLPQPESDAVQFLLLLRRSKTDPPPILPTGADPQGTAAVKHSPQSEDPVSKTAADFTVEPGTKDTDDKQPVSLWDNTTYRVVEPPEVEILVRKYMQTYVEKYPAIYGKKEERNDAQIMKRVRSVLYKLMTKQVLSRPVESLESVPGQKGPAIIKATVQAEMFTCVYLFADIEHLFSYIHLSLTKQKMAEKGKDLIRFKMHTINVDQGDAILCTFTRSSPGMWRTDQRTHLLMDLSKDINRVFRFLAFQKNREGQRGLSIKAPNVLVMASHSDADHLGAARLVTAIYQKLSEYLKYAFPIGRWGWNHRETLQGFKDKLNQFVHLVSPIPPSISPTSFRINISPQSSLTIYSGNTALTKGSFASQENKSGFSNANSLVAVQETGDILTILTGDLPAIDSKNGEEWLEGLTRILTDSGLSGKRYRKIILKVSHHGSRENSNPELMNLLGRMTQGQTDREVSLIISSGVNNKFHHPSCKGFFAPAAPVDTAASSTGSATAAADTGAVTATGKPLAWLYPQGQRMDYHDTDASDSSTQTLPMSIHYTANLEKHPGSIVHKSDETGTTTDFTKMYITSDEERTLQTSPVNAFALAVTGKPEIESAVLAFAEEMKARQSGE